MLLTLAKPFITLNFVLFKIIIDIIYQVCVFNVLFFSVGNITYGVVIHLSKISVFVC